MAKVGEILLSSTTALEPLSQFNGRTISCIGGGYNKLFIVEASGEVTALHPDGDEEAHTLTKLGPLVSIRCGKHVNLLLSKDGFVYSYGDGMFGALGHGGASPIATPQIVNVLSDKFVVEVACGEAHALALTKEGDVFAWGRGYEGQLGVSPSTQVLPIPKYVPLKQLIKKVACGQRHSLAIDSNGQVFTWGEGRCGQLGRGCERYCKTPKLVAFETSVSFIDIVAGAGHSAALSDKGQIFTWGLNNFGQLGTGDFKSRWEPFHLSTSDQGKMKKVFKLVSSSYACYCIDKFHKAFAWGKGSISSTSTATLVSKNIQEKDLSDLFACDDSFLCFAPLRIFSVSPTCGPSSGGTRLSLIGTAFAVTDMLRVRFKYGHLVIESTCEYDAESSSIQLFTPKFVEEGEILDLPVEAEIDVTMDGLHYVKSEKNFLIYPSTLALKAVSPKCASVEGGTSLEIVMNLDAFDKKWLWHLSVGFVHKPKGLSVGKMMDFTIKDTDESRVSFGSARNEDLIMTPGTYEDGKIVCTVPKIVDFDEDSLTYLVDVLVNGQQATFKPLNFRYYQVEIYDLTPITGLSDEGTIVKVSGKGLYDSSSKKARILTPYGSRELPVQWDRPNKAFIFTVPPVAWILESEEPDMNIVKEITEQPVNLEITLNDIDYIPLSSFYYIDPVVMRISKVKMDETLTPEQKEALWMSEEAEEEEEPELRTKRETEEDTLMQMSTKPGTKFYLWTNKIIQTDLLSAVFTLEGNSVVQSAVFKNQYKLGVVVPDLGDIPQPAEAFVTISLNGQNYSKQSIGFKYIGASAQEEVPKRRK